MAIPGESGVSKGDEPTLAALLGKKKFFRKNHLTLTISVLNSVLIGSPILNNWRFAWSLQLTFLYHLEKTFSPALPHPGFTLILQSEWYYISVLQKGKLSHKEVTTQGQLSSIKNQEWYHLPSPYFLFFTLLGVPEEWLRSVHLNNNK